MPNIDRPNRTLINGGAEIKSKDQWFGCEGAIFKNKGQIAIVRTFLPDLGARSKIKILPQQLRCNSRGASHTCALVSQK